MSMNLGTLAIASKQNAIFTVGNDGIKAILIGCESGLTCTITMEGGGVQKTLYPGTVDWFDVRKGFTGNIKIAPVAILNNVATFPASTLIFDAIGVNDSEQASMYPIALPSRNTNVGNAVNTTMGGSTNVQNDNNAANTQFIEATVSGSPSSNVSVDNSGNTFIAQTVAGVVTKLFQTVANASPSVLLGAVGKLTEVLGNLQVDGNLDVDGTLNADGNTTLGGTLGVTGVSTLTGEVDAGSDIKLTTNGSNYYGKDHAGSSYSVIGFDSTTNKQLNILDGTAGQLANVKSNTKVNGTLEVTGNATLDSTLTVTGNTTASGNLIFAHGSVLEFKDSGGTARSILNNSNDIVTIQATPLGDRVIISDSANTETYLDLQTNAIIIGDATALLPVEIRGSTILDYGGTNTISTDGAGRLTINGAGTGLTVTNDGLVSGKLTVSSQIIASLINAPASNNLTTNVATGQKHALQVNNADVVDVNANGLTLLSGAIDINSAPITVNGSTSGTASIYQFFQGSYKKVIVIMNNFRNGGGSNQDQALTTPFTATTMITSTATINAISLVASGVAQTVGVLTTLNASGGGTTTNETALQSSSFAYFNGAWDTIRFVSGQASAHSGMVIFEGV